MSKNQRISQIKKTNSALIKATISLGIVLVLFLAAFATAIGVHFDTISALANGDSLVLSSSVAAAPSGTPGDTETPEEPVRSEFYVGTYTIPLSSKIDIDTNGPDEEDGIVPIYYAVYDCDVEFTLGDKLIGTVTIGDGVKVIYSDFYESDEDNEFCIEGCPAEVVLMFGTVIDFDIFADGEEEPFVPAEGKLFAYCMAPSEIVELSADVVVDLEIIPFEDQSDDIKTISLNNEDGLNSGYFTYFNCDEPIGLIKNEQTIMLITYEGQTYFYSNSIWTNSKNDIYHLMSSAYANGHNFEFCEGITYDGTQFVANEEKSLIDISGTFPEGGVTIQYYIGETNNWK